MGFKHESNVSTLSVSSSGELEPKNKESSAQNKRIEISEVSFYKKSNGSKDSCFSTLKAGIMCDRQLGYFCNMYLNDGC